MNWQVVTFFGDSTVLLPSAAVLFIVLFLQKDSKQVAWHWALLFGITGAIVCASKLAFMGWGIGIRELDFTGFSGHTALSTAFWPIFLWLLCVRATPAFRFSSVVLGYALAGFVGYSRLMIAADSLFHDAPRPLTLLNLGEIAVKLGSLEKPFTRADLHKRFY